MAKLSSPHFLCIGAAKSATTSLFNILKQHPLISVSSFKEPHFFDISDKDLKDGMFVKGYVTGEVLKNVYKIPRNKLVKDKNVFIKKNNILAEKEIKVIYFDNDSVIISGLDNQDCVIDNYRNYFYDGMEIN